MALQDTFGRSHTYLRISVTDRCNYRCVYCMPEQGMQWVPRTELLRYEEIARIVRIMAQLGVQKVRLTGGEPTMRADIISLVEAVASIPGITDVAMTTNAHTLEALARPLADAGLNRVNVSIDSLVPERFKRLTRGGSLERVMNGIHAARAAGLTPIKLNAVVLAGQNEDEVSNFIDYFSQFAADTELRFIEYMPFEERRHQSIPASTLRKAIRQHWTLEHDGHRNPTDGPAVRYRIAETGLRVGFISPLSEHFCATCNRLRLMANGHLRTCLAHEDTPSLRDIMRQGHSDATLSEAICAMVLGKPSGHDCGINDGTPFEGVMTAIGG